MLENSDEYRARTCFMWDSIAKSGGFKTSDGLRCKVSDNGKIKKLYGDTVIFLLEDAVKAWLSDIREELYSQLGDILAEKLIPDTFHITLHDLRSSASCFPSEIEEDKLKTETVIENAKRTFNKDITIVSTCVFSMVGTSIVMGFEPKTDEDTYALMALYEELQGIVRLNYPLTLHATLAYYKPGEYSEEVLLRMREAFGNIGRERRECVLSIKGLCFSTFDSMNSYSAI